MYPRPPLWTITRMEAILEDIENTCHVRLGLLSYKREERWKRPMLGAKSEPLSLSGNICWRFHTSCGSERKQ